MQGLERSVVCIEAAESFIEQVVRRSSGERRARLQHVIKVLDATIEQLKELSK